MKSSGRIIKKKVILADVGNTSIRMVHLPEDGRFKPLRLILNKDILVDKNPWANQNTANWQVLVTSVNKPVLVKFANLFKSSQVKILDKKIIRRFHI